MATTSHTLIVQTMVPGGLGKSFEEMVAESAKMVSRDDVKQPTPKEMEMSVYKRAVLVGLSMGVVGAFAVVVLSLLGCPKEIALAVAIGLVSASMVTLTIKRDRSQ